MTSCLDCFFFGRWEVGEGVGKGRRYHGSVLGLLLNCESALIDITAKDASLSFIVSAAQITDVHISSGDSKDHRSQNGLWRQYRP